MAKQPGEEGSSRSLILSLLLDHALLLHPEQRARLENQQPACTVGSLRQFSQGEALLESIRSVLAAENVAERFAQLTEQVKTWFILAPSGKHMSGRDLGRQEPMIFCPGLTANRLIPQEASAPNPSKTACSADLGC